jgi:predicted ATP-dependent protease
VPKSIEASLLVDDYIRAKIEIVHVETLGEALAHALDAEAATKLSLSGRLADTGVTR